MEICRRLGVTEQSFCRWKRKFAGLGGGALDHRLLGPAIGEIAARLLKPHLLAA